MGVSRSYPALFVSAPECRDFVLALVQLIAVVFEHVYGCVGLQYTVFHYTVYGLFEHDCNQLYVVVVVVVVVVSLISIFMRSMRMHLIYKMVSTSFNKIKLAAGV